MSQDADDAPARLRWARLRFSIIGPLLASPAEPGELASRIRQLAETTWRHPTTGEVLRYSAKTIERMYYVARGKADPFRALERKVPSHAGTHPTVSEALAKAIAAQYEAHRGWSYQLHYDNLVAAANGQCQGSCRVNAISERARPSFAERRWNRLAAGG